MAEWSLIEQHLDRLERDFMEELITAASNGSLELTVKMAARVELIREFRAMPDEIIGEPNDD